MSENKFIDGLFVNTPHPKAPDFVKGSIAIHKDRFTEWLQNEQANEKGYIKIDILGKKDGSGWYAKVNDYEKKKFMTEHQGDNMAPSSNCPF